VPRSEIVKRLLRAIQTIAEAIEKTEVFNTEAAE